MVRYISIIIITITLYSCSIYNGLSAFKQAAKDEPMLDSCEQNLVSILQDIKFAGNKFPENINQFEKWSLKSLYDSLKINKDITKDNVDSLLDNKNKKIYYWYSNCTSNYNINDFTSYNNDSIMFKIGKHKHMKSYNSWLSITKNISLKVNSDSLIPQINHVTYHIIKPPVKSE